MNLLPTLKDLQATLDNLRTIERDLSAFPPDLAALDQEQKAIVKQTSDTEKALQEWRAKRKCCSRLTRKRCAWKSWRGRP